MMGGPDSEAQLEAVDMAHTFISVGNPVRPCWAFLLLKWYISSCVAVFLLCSCIISIISIIIIIIIIIIYHKYKFENMGYRAQRKYLF